MQDKSRLYIFILLGVGLVIKIIYLSWAYDNPGAVANLSVDPLFHYNWAGEIANGHLLANAPYFRAPLYPFLLAGLYKISGGSIVFMRLVQLLGGCLTLLLIYAIGAHLKNRTAGVLAAALYLLYPMTTYFEGELLLDSIFTLMALLCLFMIFKDNGSVINAFWTGLILALAALTRPTVLIFLPVIIYYYSRKKYPDIIVKPLARMILFLATALLFISPVLIINYVTSGQFIPISYQGGINFYIGNNPDADGLHASLPPIGHDWTLEDASYLQQNETGTELRYGEQSRFWLVKGLRFIAANPSAFLKLTAKKLFYLFNNAEVSNNRSLKEAVFENPLLGWMPVSFNMLIGLAVLPLIMTGTRNKSAAAVYLIIVFYTLTISLFFINSRFRLPLVPLISILAGIGLYQVYEIVRKRKWTAKALLAVLAAIAVFVISTNNIYGDVLDNPEQALFNRANAMLRDGKYQDAVYLYDSLATMAPSYKNCYINMGIAYLKSGNADAAYASFRRQIITTPGSAEAYGNVAGLELLQGDFDSSLVYATYALALKPYHFEASLTLIRAASRTQNDSLRNAAESKRVEIRRYFTGNPKYLFEEAVYFAAMGRYREAIDGQLRVLDLLSHTRPEVSFEFDFSFRSRIDYNQVEAQANYQLGYLYGLTGDYAKAIRFSTRAITLDPELKQAYLNLFSGFLMDGQKGKADSVLNIIETRWPQWLREQQP